MIELQLYDQDMGDDQGITTKYSQSIEVVRQIYMESKRDWVVGFSGGKDSSMVLKIIINAIKGMPQYNNIYVVYCDTGVEIPIISDYTNEIITKLKLESKEMGIKMYFIKAGPNIQDRFFVKVLGRGYPPPTNKFRWCTDKLRIKPISSLIKKMHISENYLLVLGTRFGESLKRDATLSKYKISDYLFSNSSSAKNPIFAPIADWTTEEVWKGLTLFLEPKSLDGFALARLYKGTTGECPTIGLTKGAPCSKGRFGCWTCTVISEDKALKNLGAMGFIENLKLLEWKKELLKVRSNPQFRCVRRRNGKLGLGPLTLEAREILLKSLIGLQSEVGIELISVDEINFIHSLMEKDRKDENYLYLERDTSKV